MALIPTSPSTGEAFAVVVFIVVPVGQGVGTFTVVTSRRDLAVVGTNVGTVVGTVVTTVVGTKERSASTLVVPPSVTFAISEYAESAGFRNLDHMGSSDNVFHDIRCCSHKFRIHIDQSPGG